LQKGFTKAKSRGYIWIVYRKDIMIFSHSKEIKMNSNHKFSFLCIYIYLLIVSCEGPVGPEGQDGVANIIVKEYTFTNGDIISNSSSARIEQSISEITSSVVDSGTVIVEWNNTSSTTNPTAWQQLPITIPIDSDDDVTHTLTYSYFVELNVDTGESEGKLVISQSCITYYYSDGEFGINLSCVDDITLSDSYQKKIMKYFLGPFKVSIFTPPSN